eukprot:SAG11_NODE_14013_length_628_cov_8.506616_1_plen_78_part_00
MVRRSSSDRFPLENQAGQNRILIFYSQDTGVLNLHIFSRAKHRDYDSDVLSTASSITKFSTAKYPVPVLYKDGDVWR